MLIYGAGGHASVLLSLLCENHIPVQCIFDDLVAGGNIEGIPIVHYQPAVFPDEKILIAIGDNQTRRLVAGKVLHSFACLVHPDAYIDKCSELSLGSVVMLGAIVQACSRIGKHVIINTGSIVEHHCVIHDYAHVGPGVVLCGQASVGEGTLIGAGSVVCPNIFIGANCIIGAGTVVTRNIPDHSVARGNPARIIKASCTR
ncbi:acetyltransferase [Dyadobacter sandarakinus]|uniref:Acetyltransferase n=1 Tax=Dyadobacter sandarakinus TaxID=2747268 RepID=A0ABX7IC69_9BACT|nr:acetyltransferase [Dyadobacter sandarakinus]QRR03057.1 acetyltransferase [Dyadobacter sandarakinus]